MFEDLTVMELVKSVLLFLNFLIFLLGVLLLLYGNYSRIEELLGKEVGGIKKKIFPKLEANHYAFHQWLLQKKTIVGLIVVVCSVLFFLTLRVM